MRLSLAALQGVGMEAGGRHLEAAQRSAALKEILLFLFVFFFILLTNSAFSGSWWCSARLPQNSRKIFACTASGHESTASRAESVLVPV